MHHQKQMQSMLIKKLYHFTILFLRSFSHLFPGAYIGQHSILTSPASRWLTIRDYE